MYKVVSMDMIVMNMDIMPVSGGADKQGAAPDSRLRTSKIHGVRNQAWLISKSKDSKFQEDARCRDANHDSPLNGSSSCLGNGPRKSGEIRIGFGANDDTKWPRGGHGWLRLPQYNISRVYAWG